MSTIALYNIKGGVGKTAGAVNLSYLASRDGAQTLLWDLDPQGAATYTFRIKPRVRGGTRKLIRRRYDVDGAVKGTDYPNLDLLPADFTYRHLDVLLDGLKKPRQRLRRMLKPLVREYDYIFIDCPPGISLASEAVFEAVDLLLVPTIPSPLSMRTVEQLFAFKKKEGLRRLEVAPYFSMVDGRRVIHRRLIREVPEKRPEFHVATIPFAADVEQMALRREPLHRYASASKSAAAFERLWEEVKERLTLQAGK